MKFKFNFLIFYLYLNLFNYYLFKFLFNLIVSSLYFMCIIGCYNNAYPISFRRTPRCFAVKILGTATTHFSFYLAIFIEIFLLNTGGLKLFSKQLFQQLFCLNTFTFVFSSLSFSKLLFNLHFFSALRTCTCTCTDPQLNSNANTFHSKFTLVLFFTSLSSTTTTIICWIFIRSATVIA